MKCPVCHQDQVIVEVEGVALDLCPDGHGAWFDADEVALLFLAVGVSPEAARFDRDLLPLARRDPRHAPGRRRCPRCRRRLRSTLAEADPHPVVLDRCPRGHGLFFDPGEIEALLAARVPERHLAFAKVQSFLEAFDRPKVAEGARPAQLGFNRQRGSVRRQEEESP